MRGSFGGGLEGCHTDHGGYTDHLAIQPIAKRWGDAGDTAERRRRDNGYIAAPIPSTLLGNGSDSLLCAFIALKTDSPKTDVLL